MPDIFLSYARADSERAEQIATALFARGWHVWWDPTLTPGETFRVKIHEQLRSARCVVVLWSTTSIESDWVIDEADDGKRRKILVQVLIDDVLPPLGFRQIQTATLTQWDGRDSREFARLCAAISAYAPRSAPPEQRPPTDARQAQLVRSSLSRLSLPEQWRELERRFKNLDSTLFADSKIFSPESWLLGSESHSVKSESEFQVLAEQAGELLPKTSQIWAEVLTASVVFIINATDPIDRWLRFLRGDRGGDVGPIRNLAKVSAEACAYCASKALFP